MTKAPTIEIAGRAIGQGHAPYLVAELSGNHNGELSRALELVDAAAEAGADAVKLQTYTADSLTIDIDGPGFVVEDGLWKGRRLYELYQEAHTPWDWMAPLFERGRERGVAVFSSPFDHAAVDLLEALDAPAYKIASFEMCDIPLVERCARTGRPLVISTGMATEDEIAETVAAAKAAGDGGIVLLHCVSGYPSPAEDMNLRTLPDMASRFGAAAGLSDHTLGTAVSVAAAALGAVLIERHITLRRADGGPDAAFSLEPEEFARLVTDVRTAYSALGEIDYDVKPSERANAVFRRSLYAVEDIAAGETLTARNVRSIRPATGLPPRDYGRVLGLRARAAIARGTPLAWDLIK